VEGSGFDWKYALRDRAGFLRRRGCLPFKYPPPPPHPPLPPSIVSINSRSVICINIICINQIERGDGSEWAPAERQFVKDCRSWFFGRGGTVSGDGRSSGCCTLGNDGRVLGWVSVMVVTEDL